MKSLNSCMVRDREQMSGLGPRVVSSASRTRARHSHLWIRVTSCWEASVAQTSAFEVCGSYRDSCSPMRSPAPAIEICWIFTGRTADAKTGGPRYTCFGVLQNVVSDWGEALW